MLRALLYLRAASIANMVSFRIRRLRQPKYFLGALAACCYFYFMVVRNMARTAPALGSSGPLVSQIMVGFICAAGAMVALVRIAITWLWPKHNPGLRFSEAEIAFLFPAPVTRRALIHFRLASAQIAILFTSFLIVFFFRRFAGPAGSRVYQTVGWWVILSVFELHVTGTDLTLAGARERGSALLLRLGAVAAIASYAAAVLCLGYHYLSSPAASALLYSGERGFVDALHGLFAWRPFWVLTLPFQVVFAPYFSTGPGEFARAMGPAALMLGLHYEWVTRSQVRFEEASIAMAERRTAMRDAMLQGKVAEAAGTKTKAMPGPFPLKPSGAPEMAFLWKNLLSMRASLLNRRIILLCLWFLVVCAVAVRPMIEIRAREGNGLLGPGIAVMSVMAAAYVLLAGPQQARQDLRSDMPCMDILKTYPVPGWRLALGELMAPTLLMTLCLWVCILAFSLSIDAAGSLEWLTPGVRVAGAACLAMATPAICMLQLMIPNAMVVLLPGWHQAGRARAPGIENMGQRLILGVGQLLISLFAAAPAAIAASLVFFSSQWILGSVAGLFLALGVVLCVLVSEAVVALWLIGNRVDAFDLSAETR